MASCSNGQNKQETMDFKYTNALINETSPYLLQHAHNPVDWHAWNKATLALARRVNKPLLISIGYSSCHWCHVMEHQSFEDEEVAKFMNEHFICIKVDREEHPDVDQIYMQAVQLITGSGGWPLNCFALPDGRPFYGGTYFGRDQWLDVLKQLANLYENKHIEAIKYATNLEKGIKSNEKVIKVKAVASFKKLDLDIILNKWVRQFDYEEGGPNRVPKFPLPNNYKFLMRYAKQENDSVIEKQVKLTLDKMANGGIYDQLGGGFARYSTDKIWKVPHFEKMLYDNAQLVSLYSDAYKNYGDENYKRVIIETLEFIKREMTNKDGLFYSALDADSDGEEGKFYVWTKEKIDSILGKDAKIFEEFYQMNNIGHWEDDKFILMRTTDIESIGSKYNINREQLIKTIKHDKALLMKERDKRVRPGLDDKSLLSWNSMMITAYCDAYTAIGDNKYKNMAQNAMDFILNNMQKNDGSFWHTYKNGESKINAYLDDYAHTIEALIRLYEIGVGNKYLYKAQELSAFITKKFYDKKSGMFFYTSSDDEVLVSRKIEIFDNVIPSSNSVIAKDLLKISIYFDKEEYKVISNQMLHNINDKFENYGASLSNWGLLMMDFIGPTKEVVVVGENSLPLLHELQMQYMPQVIWAIDTRENTKISLLQDRYKKDKTLIYVCVGKACQLPVEKAEDAMEIILE